MAAIGAPKAWTWANDRFGAGLWSISAILLIASAVAWASKGAARSVVTHHHGHVGTAQALALIGVFVGLIACYRRWGTGGARGHVAVHDAQDAAILSEAVRREGRGQGPGADAPGVRQGHRRCAGRRVPARPLVDRRAGRLELAGPLGRELRLSDLDQLEAARVDPEAASGPYRRRGPPREGDPEQ